MHRLLEELARTKADRVGGYDANADRLRELRQRVLDTLAAFGTETQEQSANPETSNELEAEIIKIALQAADADSEFNRIIHKASQPLGPLSIDDERNFSRSPVINERRWLRQAHSLDWDVVRQSSAESRREKRIAAEGLLLVPFVLGVYDDQSDTGARVALTNLSRLGDPAALPVIVERARLDVVVAGQSPTSTSVRLGELFLVATELAIADTEVSPHEIGYLLEMIGHAESGAWYAERLDEVVGILVEDFRRRGFAPVVIPDESGVIPRERMHTNEDLQRFRAIWNAAFGAYPKGGLTPGQSRFVDMVTRGDAPAAIGRSASPDDA